ncbi:MAG: hypothetical protein AAF402_12695 [Pseudomonadota bacterium]
MKNKSIRAGNFEKRLLQWNALAGNPHYRPPEQTYDYRDIERHMLKSRALRSQTFLNAIRTLGRKLSCLRFQRPLNSRDKANRPQTLVTAMNNDCRIEVSYMQSFTSDHSGKTSDTGFKKCA